MALKKTAELSPEEALVKAKNDAFRLLSFRARSVSELRERLVKKKYASETVEETLSFCLKQGFLDDEKFAKLYAISRVQSRPSGKRLIQTELKNKGLSPAVVNRALGAIEDFDEKELAFETALKRYQRMRGLPEKTSKARIYGFLSRRGFSSEAVFYSLSKLYKNAGME